MARPVGLQPDDLTRVMEQFGVAAAQVQRDHAISHILAVLSELCRDGVVFFGGTALSRTYLREERLSEDVDLIALTDRDSLADTIRAGIDSGLARTHGRLRWSRAWSRHSDIDAAVAITSSGIAVRIQLLRRDRYARWPTELHDIEQRYADAPPARLWTPTLSAFVGLKTAAWFDRGAARDLYDLWALGNVGALNADAGALFAALGPTGNPPRPWMFERAPSPAEWHSQLSEQTLLTITADEALEAVRTAWSTTTPRADGA
jgi:predicted nucleotidyltransferase component of viral defense system